MLIPSLGTLALDSTIGTRSTEEFVTESNRTRSLIVHASYAISIVAGFLRLPDPNPNMPKPDDAVHPIRPNAQPTPW